MTTTFTGPTIDPLTYNKAKRNSKGHTEYALLQISVDLVDMYTEVATA